MKQAKRKNKLAFEVNLDDLIILLGLVAAGLMAWWLL